MTSVDVVVVSFCNSQHLRGCVQTLAGLTDVRVFVVDNASTDGSLESVADLPVTSLPQEDNGGFARGCNIGCRASSAPYVLLLNPDARIDLPCLEALARRLDTDQSIGAVAPKILNADATLDFSLRRFPRLRSTYAQALFLHRLFPKTSWSEIVSDDASYARSWEPEWASGACLLLRRTALEEIEGLDEDFFLYCEDKDLCRRLRDAGYRIVYEPGATCCHVGGASSPRNALRATLVRSRLRYAAKHMSPTRLVLERVGIALGELTHTVAGKGGWTGRKGHLRAFRASFSRDEPVLTSGPGAS